MRGSLCLLLGVSFLGFLSGGCNSSGQGGGGFSKLMEGFNAPTPIERDDEERAMFGPARMRLHPIFTQVKDWTGNGSPDGIQAELEFQDQFGDSTKAAGKVMFELYEYVQNIPEHRGKRLVNPWIGSLASVEEQRLRWNRTSRTYTFQLAMPSASVHKSYVLEAMFEHTGGRRFFSRVILEAQIEEQQGVPMPPSATQPTTRPARASTQPAQP